jgi:hypothetical protein
LSKLSCQNKIKIINTNHNSDVYLYFAVEDAEEDVQENNIPKFSAFNTLLFRKDKHLKVKCKIFGCCFKVLNQLEANKKNNYMNKNRLTKK